MDTPEIQYTLEAKWALDVLDPDERARIQEQLRRLATGDNFAGPVRRLEGTPDKYMLVASRFLIPFQKGPDGTLIVLDIANRAVVENYFRSAAG